MLNLGSNIVQSATCFLFGLEPETIKTEKSENRKTNTETNSTVKSKDIKEEKKIIKEKKQQQKSTVESEEIKEEKKLVSPVIRVKPKETVNVDLSDFISKEKKSKPDTITMSNRKQKAVVKIKTVEEKSKEKIIDKGQNSDNKSLKEEQHRIQHLINYLSKDKVAFTQPIKTSTGLYEMKIIQKTGNPVLISVDINGLLYSDEIKFFLGRIMPGEEYIRPAIMMTDNSINAIVNGEKIPSRYFITEQLFLLNKLVDLQTLKEKDPKKRAKVFETLAKALSDKDIYDGILKAANGEPYRFAFARYINENEFSVVSSKRNLSSNLTNDKLLTSKEIWIKIKDKDVKLTTKSCDK